MRRRWFLALPALAGCSPIGLANFLTSGTGVAREEAIPYGPLPRHRLDLYRPEGLPASAPVLAFFHGGGWTSGSRADYAFAALPLARLGALVAVPDYRLFPEIAYPGFVEDGALALAVLRAREPSRPLVVVGHSAGAFIAAALALDGRWGARDGVAGFVGLAGPYDFGAEEASPPAIFAGLPRVVAAPGPLEGAPPLLLLHGAADTTVRPHHSRRLATRARVAGVPARHVEYPGMGHIGILAALAAPVRRLGLANGDVLDEVQRFVHGCHAPVPSGACRPQSVIRRGEQAEYRRHR